MNPTDMSFEQLVRDEAFRKYYGGLSSRFNSRKLKHSLVFYNQDGCSYLTLCISNDRYKFVMTVGEMGKVGIYVSDAGSMENVRVDEFQFQTTDEFFDSYPVIFNEYFPRQQNRA